MLCVDFAGMPAAYNKLVSGLYTVSYRADYNEIIFDHEDFSLQLKDQKNTSVIFCKVQSL